MKKIIAISALMLLLIVPSLAMASSYYLTLEGTVGSIQDSAHLASSANIGVGAKVQYVLEIDTDRMGSYEEHGRVRQVNNSYFSSLYAGVLNGQTGDQYNFLNEKNTWFRSAATNEKSGISLTSWETPLDELAVGSKIGYMHEYSYNQANNWTYTQLTLRDVTVTNISNVAPTPIPGAAVVMLGGLGVLGAFRRRFSK